MQERHDFEHERNLDEDLSVEQKVRKLWRERELRMYIRERRMALLGLWIKCLSGAAAAGAIISLIIGAWKK